ncbi:hypothetical protein AA14337_2886 [Acetobacter malorum DSM 14337]|uniref:Uncharacterized protein n=1 Tax=Acetobacter malorum DSM 14337 TaxID=1307910 RepID=A0ABQ0PYE3_9PROT|nr:hypothetical protein AA14337_2886 [Acetobacter malorum DSM 14337]
MIFRNQAAPQQSKIDISGEAASLFEDRIRPGKVGNLHANTFNDLISGGRV